VELKEKLRGVLFRRYSVDAKLLDLSALGQDQTLVELGLFTASATAEKAFKVLLTVCDQQFKTAQEKRDAIQSVSLASNSLGNVAQVFDLAETFPQLKALDLSSNQIDKLNKLGRWRYRFRNLQTLILSDNPIESEEPNYHAELLEWFPKLQVINGHIVRTAEEIAAREAATRPQPIPQGVPDFRDAEGVAEQFVRQFIPLFDNDRNQLLSLFYDEESRFSLAITTHALREIGTTPLKWQTYMRFSRNHSKINSETTRFQRLFDTSSLIADVFRQLPATKHPDLTELHKYMIECQPVPGLVDPSGQSPAGVTGLNIHINGEFSEEDPESKQVGKRSFARSFVIGPGAPGRNRIRVVSDLLSLRAWKPVQSTDSHPTAAVEQEQELKQQMVIELSKRTNMTPEYSNFCLEGVNWDFEKALIIFEEKKVCSHHIGLVGVKD
jgi:nuclear RNA export factor